MDERYDMVIAQLIGEPINVQHPVPVEISAIADIFTAEPGEHVWRYKNLDETADVVLAIDATDGKITVVKRSPLQDIELTFSGFNSKLDYVLVDEILNRVDTDALARRKEAISRGMDKYELALILNAILTPTNAVFPYNEVGGTTITPVSGEDIYDVIMRAKQALEDYGDQFVLLCGSTVKNKIDTYDKDNASTFHYNVTLPAKLRELGIDVMKIFGKVANDTGETEDALLDTNTFILIAKNSRISEGKPIKFVRRKISPAIAAQMGADVTNTQRALMVTKTPMPVDFSGTSSYVLGYGVYGYESIVFCITNPHAIATCDAEDIL